MNAEKIIPRDRHDSLKAMEAAKSAIPSTENANEPQNAHGQALFLRLNFSKTDCS